MWRRGRQLTRSTCREAVVHCSTTFALAASKVSFYQVHTKGRSPNCYQGTAGISWVQIGSCPVETEVREAALFNTTKRRHPSCSVSFGIRKSQPESLVMACLRRLQVSLMMLGVASLGVTVSAQGCTGYLPGNCRFELGQGYMMCNAGKICSDFGVPANNCATGDVCTRMCEAAPSYGGTCDTDNIPWQLSCGDVSVLRRQILISGAGVVNCDEKIQVRSSGVIYSISRELGHKLLL